MIQGLWQSAAGLQTQEYRQAIIANNLANVDTPGFKPDRITFHERLSAARAADGPRVRHPVLDNLPGGVFETPVYTDFSQSGFMATGGALDVAVAGKGFLVVQTPEGPRYTRDGSMLMDKDGALVHQATNRPMADARGRAIVLDRNSTESIHIDDTGRVMQGDEVVAELGLVDFADQSVLEKTGDNLLDAGGALPIEASGTLLQRNLESSGVDSVSSLVEMIEATRTYQMNATLLTLQDESLSRVVNDVGRIG